MVDKLKEINEQISQTFERVIANAQIKDLPGIIKALAQVDSETERAVYVEKLSRKFGIGKRAIIKDIKNNSRTPEMKKKASVTSVTSPISIIEIVKTDQGLRYCLSDYEIKDSLEINGTVYKPPENSDLVYLPTNNFFKIGLEDSDQILFEDIGNFIYDHLDIQESFGYKILTLWVLHTWLLDKFDTSPILHFLGPYASGKSRAGDVMSILAKRGLATVNLTGAPIFRVNEMYQPTFIIDEVKLTGKDRDRDILELLNARFQRGRKVIRINTEKAGLDSIQEFDVFGATVLCGLDELPETPRSRAIIFTMEQNMRPVAKKLDFKRADILRDRLCAFRGRYIEEKMPQVERFLKDGRLCDAVEPLHQIFRLVKPDIELDFIEFFKTIESERQEETYDSFDAEVVQALIKCRDKIKNGKIQVADITSAFNQGRNESDHLNIRTIGKVLTRLKLKKTRASDGKFARFWEEKRIDRLCRKYGLTEDTEDNEDKNLILGETENNLLQRPKVIDLENEEMEIIG
ncbi:MAG: hypothetical protein AB1606_07265 [Nitrospirota bacterium]